MIKELSVKYSISSVSRAFSISRSLIYSYLKQEEREMERMDRVREKYKGLKLKFDELCREFPKYGYRRIRIMLRRRHGIWMSKKTVQKIMRAFNLSLPTKKKRTQQKTYDKSHKIQRPNQLWQTDLTKVWVKGSGWCFLFAVIDCFTREILGWCFSLFGSAKEAIKALERAVELRFPYGIPEDISLTVNSDNGNQFGARVYQKAVRDFGFEFTRTGYDTPEDNAYIESFFGKFKEEEVWTKEYEGFLEAESEIEEWIWWYNNERIHSSLNYLTPVEFRKAYYENLQASEREQLHLNRASILS